MLRKCAAIDNFIILRSFCIGMNYGYNLDYSRVTEEEFMGIDDDRRLSLALLLVARLERLSADSLWSHRASGLRGAVLRYLELIEAEPAGDGIDRAAFDILIENGFVVLQKAAGEIEVRESG